MKRIIITGASFAALSVAMGAFAAHGLKKIVDGYSIEIFQKGVTYQMYHALAILICGILFHLHGEKRFVLASRIFVAGICCFSGSLYILALKQYVNINTNIIGPLTPLGGLFFMAGWLVLISAIYRKRE